MDSCKKIFYSHYNVEKDDERLEKIINLAGKHTLTVDLLAHTAEEATLSISSLYQKLKEKGFNLDGIINEEISTFWDNEKESLTLFEYLLKVFDIAKVSNEEKEVLMNLSILPSIDFQINEIKEWLKLETNKSINSLVKKGCLNKSGFNIKIHPLIQETIRYKLNPNTEKCNKLIEEISFRLRNKVDEGGLSKKRYITLGESILNYLNEDNLSIALLVNNLAITLDEIGQSKEALKYQLRDLAIREKVLGKSHPQVAISYNNLSLIYRSLWQLEDALKMQLAGIEILENSVDGIYSELGIFYNNIASIYHDLEELEIAFDYQLQAIEIRTLVFKETGQSKMKQN